jgi:hypothetical protein
MMAVATWLIGATVKRARAYSAARSSTNPGASVRTDRAQGRRPDPGYPQQRSAICGQQCARNQSTPRWLGVYSIVPTISSVPVAPLCGAGGSGTGRTTFSRSELERTG